MTSPESPSILQGEINGTHLQLEQDVGNARLCAINSIAMPIKLRTEYITALEGLSGETRDGLQLLVEEVNEEIAIYLRTLGYIADAQEYVRAFSPWQPE